MSFRIEHTALSVANLERSISFYCDLIGFEVLQIIESPKEGRLGEVVSIPGCSARLALLQLGGRVLELFEYLEPKGKPISQSETQADKGFSHLCFATDDVWADYEKLKQKGVRFYNKPIEIRPGVTVVYLYGPDNETCELRQANI